MSQWLIYPYCPYRGTAWPLRFIALVAVLTFLAVSFQAVAQGQNNDPAQGKVVINGDVTINVKAGQVTTSASNQADGTPSVARSCVGSIGDGNSDVRIEGDVKISRSIGNATDGCDCGQQGNPCTRQ